MRRRKEQFSPEYNDLVLSTDPIAYWQLDEKGGAVAYERVSERGAIATQNGAYTGVTLGEPGIGDGRTSGFYDGLTDFTNIWTASFQANFALTNHALPLPVVSEGSAMIWPQVANAGVWTDGITRDAMRLRVDVANQVILRRPVLNNNFQWVYTAGGVLLGRNRAGETTLDPFCAVITWSAAADEVRAYWNGVQEGAVINGLGIWAGNLAATTTVIGATSTVPANVWHGWLAHGAVWNRPLSPAEVWNLYRWRDEAEGLS